MMSFLNRPSIIALRYGQCVLALVIFYYAALKPAGQPGGAPPLLLHFIGNVLLIASCWLAVLNIIKLRFLFSACLFISLSAELAQSFTNTRTSDPLDFMMNLFGLLSGLFLCKILEKVRSAISHSPIE